ncbi:MAG: PAS domain-containing protein [Thermoplasmatota archaeon]
MGEWIRKFFSDSVSQSGIKKGEDASGPNVPVVGSSRATFRKGSRSTRNSELEDAVDIRTAISELLSSLIDSRDLGALSRVLEEGLPAIVPYDIGTLRWSRPDPSLEDQRFQMEDDFPESIDLIAKGSILEGSRDVQMQGPVHCEAGGIWSGHMEGVCRARTISGEPLMIRMSSGLVVPLFYDDDEIGVLLLFSTREGVLDLLGNEPSLQMVWKGIGSTLGRMVAAMELHEDLQRTRELLNSTEEILVLWREVDQLWEIDCNSNAERFFLRDAMTPEMMEGPFFAPPGKEFERAMDAWRKVLDTGETSIVELELLSVEGEKVLYLCLLSPYDPDGETVGVRMTGIRSGLVKNVLPELMGGRVGNGTEDVDVASLVEGIVREHREANCSQEVVLEQGTGACGIRVHPVLGRAVSTLLSHSARNSVQGRRLSVGMTSDVRGVTITILNDGGPSDIREDRETGRENLDANFDLVTAYGIVELHGGSIMNGGSDGNGGSFRISLPWTRS